MERVYAQEVSVSLESVFSPAKSFTTFGQVVSVVLKNAFVAAGVIALVLLIFGGFSYIVAAGSGDAKALEKGKKAMTSAVIGLLLVVFSVWIVQLIALLTGVQLPIPK